MYVLADVAAKQNKELRDKEQKTESPRATY